MKRLVPVSVIVLAALLVGITPLAASAQAGPTTIYVVQPGDTAYSIATRHCMSVQQLYNLNGAVISNPNQIYPGMQLRVVNQCGGGSGCSGYNCGGSGSSGAYYCGTGVYDRGPSLHARGWVSGNVYTVMLGDTSWSIAQRFGISVNALCSANGINPWFIWAGQRLVIPGLNSGSACPPQPCPPSYPGGCVPIYPTFVPTVIPITPVPTTAPVQSRITITAPAAYSTLPPTFTVTGTGQGLFEGTVVVRAINNSGAILAEVPTTLQGANVGAGGPGTFSVQLTVNTPQPTAGFVVAFAPQTPNAQAVSVPVTFSASGGGGNVVYHEYQGSQCRVAVLAGQPYFSEVGGTPLGTFANQGTYTATRGAKLNNQAWYFIGPVPGSTPNVWAPFTSVGMLSPACYW